MSVEEERVFHNLSTTYQQIVDNVGKDIHGTHRGFYPQFFPLQFSHVANLYMKNREILLF